MLGYTHRLLRVDLSARECSVEALQDDVLRQYLGGRGLSAWLLYSELGARIDPLGPDNKLVVAAGPFQGSPIPGSTRFSVCAKSPLTGTWGEAHAAGSFGPMLRRAGYEAIVVEGQADEPVYLKIDEERSEIRDAGHLWGLTTGDTLDAIRQDWVPRAEVAAIGAAGEHLVRYASVISDRTRAAARSGVGAVMGSKNLKAVAVHGRARPTWADETALKQLAKKAVHELRDRASAEFWREIGTTGGTEARNRDGMLPVRNFQAGVCSPEDIDRIAGYAMAKTISVGNSSCAGCPVGCHRMVEVTTGPWAPVDRRYGGPEFETMGSFGSCAAMFDMEAVARANQLCNMYGLDTLNAGIMISWAIECFERGIIDSADTDGIELTWRDPGAVLSLVEDIAHRRGFGAALADGHVAAIERFGAESAAFAMHVKNQAFACHMPRGNIGQGLSYAVSNRGACHLQGMHDSTFLMGNVPPEIPLDKSLLGDAAASYDNKAPLQYVAQNWRAVEDSLIICKFTDWPYGTTQPSGIAEMLAAITGVEWSVDELLEVGERVYNLCRLFNVREGFSRKDDTLPSRVAESLPEGPLVGSVITESDLQKMLDQYYVVRGWDANGIPKPQRLEALGLGGL